MPLLEGERVMGQIADDLICGFQCSGCGVCFEGQHGYPVLCTDCYASLEKTELPKVTIKEL